MEYAYLLTKACEAKDANMRILWIGVYVMSHLTSIYEGFSKPFNPLSNETYELITDEFKFLAE